MAVAVLYGGFMALNAVDGAWLYGVYGVDGAWLYGVYGVDGVDGAWLYGVDGVDGGLNGTRWRRCLF